MSARNVNDDVLYSNRYLEFLKIALNILKDTHNPIACRFRRGVSCLCHIRLELIRRMDIVNGVLNFKPTIK